MKKPPAVIPSVSTPDPDAFRKVPRPTEMEPPPFPNPFPIFSMLSVDRARPRDAKLEPVPMWSLLTDRTPTAGVLRWRGWYGSVVELPAFPAPKFTMVFGARPSLIYCHEEPALPAGPIGMTSIASSILSSSSTARESGRSGFDNDAEEPEEDSGEGDRERCLEDDTGSERSLISSNVS